MNPTELLKRIFDGNLGLLTAKQLYTIAKREDKRITFEIVKRWYQSQRSVQILDKSTRRPYYHPIISNGKGWQVDIMFIGDPRLRNDPYIRANNKFIGLITFINTSTRFVIVEPIKSRKTSEIVRGFRNFLDVVGIGITTLTSDNEFLKNKEIDRVLEEHINKYGAEFNKRFGEQYKILRYLEQPYIHSKLGIINRFHRTLRSGLNTLFVYHNTKRWIDDIQKIIDIYNSNVNRTTGFAPKDMTEFDVSILNDTLQEKGIPGLERFRKFRVGDRVRHIIDQQNSIRKKTKRFTDNEFTITDINGFSFTLKDDKGREAPRTYRYHELRKSNLM
jgi:hypothetical protein